MKIAVTGGSGSVGREITAQAMALGHSIVSVDRVAPAEVLPGVSYIQAELADYDALVAAFLGCDALIHMAAIPSPMQHPNHVVHNNNVVGSYNAMRAAIEQGIMRITQASSVNAIGHAYSRVPRYDYFPIDECHPNYAEDPYSLSKWLCEQQAEGFARAYPGISIASLRYHWVKSRDIAGAAYTAADGPVAKHLWAYVAPEAAARAALAGIFTDLSGHEVFYICAPDTTLDTNSRELAARHFPAVSIKGDFSGNASFFNSAKAGRLLGWKHDLQSRKSIQ